MILVHAAAPPLLIHTEKGRRGHGPLRPSLRRMGRIQWEWRQNKFRDSRDGHRPYFFILIFNFKFREYMGKVQK